MTELDPIELRDRYDRQLRTWMPERLPAGATVERDGPVIRLSGAGERGNVAYVSVAHLAPAELDALIARQRDHFAARAEAVEWKLHGHDQPADLADRLRAAGFQPEEQETVVVGRAAPLAAASGLPDGVRLREVTSRVDFDRIAVMESAVWGSDQSYRGAALEAEAAATPDGITVVVAEAVAGAESTVVSAGWVRYVAGTEFATLWGGATLAGWRGRGIYQALVRYRAELAVQRGLSLLQVDASDNSRPILERHGFVAVTTTTPYVHHVHSGR